MIEADEVRHVTVEESPWVINEIKNLRIINGEGKVKHISGTTYLTLSVPHYGHILQDIYSQYRMLQFRYKDLKVVLTDLSVKGMYYGMWQPKLIDDFLDVLNYDKANIIDITKHNYSFEKVVFIFDVCNLLPNEFHLKYGTRHYHYLPFCTCYSGKQPCGESEYFAYWWSAIDILRKDFAYLFDWSFTQKLYVSRQRYNEQYKAQIDALEGKPLDAQQLATLNRAKLRYCPDEDRIENYYKKNNYQIIHAQDFGLKEQITLFSQASHLVSISGTALINVYWCHPKTIVTEYAIIPNYKWHYDVFAAYCGIEQYEKLTTFNS